MYILLVQSIRATHTSRGGALIHEDGINCNWHIVFIYIVSVVCASIIRVSSITNILTFITYTLSTKVYNYTSINTGLYIEQWATMSSISVGIVIHLLTKIYYGQQKVHLLSNTSVTKEIVGTIKLFIDEISEIQYVISGFQKLENIKQIIQKTSTLTTHISEFKWNKKTFIRHQDISNSFNNFLCECQCTLSH